jgi:2-amino-4-hydroxy-6-hydroxymethyldihydropteridine diphosphokinase
MEKVTVYLSLGSNIEDRSSFLQTAQDHIRDGIGPISAVSAVYESEPWGFQAETPFLNSVAEVQTMLGPVELMNALLSIEEKMGRVRKQGTMTSRNIDIDILFYGNMVIDSERLNIPHPRLQERRFVLEPMAGIAPLFVHPVSGLTMKDLLKQCSDSCWIRIFKA